MSFQSSRRRFVGASSTLFAAASFPSVSAQSGTATPEATPASELPAELPNGGIQTDGTWAFTDDLGITITYDSVPTRVVAHIGMAAALYDFGFQVVGYYNPATDEDGNPLPIAGDLPLDEIEHVGDFDAVDVEKILNLDAELFIGQNYSVAEGGMWPFQADQLEKIGLAVPILSFAYGDGVTVLRAIESLENLARALGADVDAPEVAADRDTFAEASNDLEVALAEKPDLTALFIAGSATGFWVGSSGSGPLTYYEQLGMNIVPDPGIGEVSWEQWLEFEADIIFVDDRVPYWWSPEQLSEEIAVWDAHPAVIAGQVAPWRAQFISSFRGFAPVITEVAEWISKVDDSIV